MRKILAVALAVLFFFPACQKNTVTNEPDEVAALPEITQRSCATYDVLQEQLAKDPTLAERMSRIEVLTQKLITSRQISRVNGGNTISIPVVVHVLYRTAEENISDAQINSQIKVLNDDYNLQNADIKSVPGIFQNIEGNVDVQFTLAEVRRVKTNKKSWAANDAMKRTSSGGDDVIDAAHNLNIWVCNLGQGLLGYAQFPGGNSATDGVVIGYFCFGSGTGPLINKYDKGRTATHEVGHWMNLRHIWGDATCGNDYVDDTPLHNAANYGCPDYPHYSTCTNKPVEMTMNYMDYTDDACMYMFTNGQKDRMRAVFASGGPRASFLP